MKIKNNTYIMLILLTSTITLLGSPGDLTFAPFDQEKHGADVERMYCEFFFDDASGVFNSVCSHTQVASLGKVVIGFVRYIDIPRNGKTRILHNIAIDTPHHKKGYGKACMNQFEAQARQDNVKRLQLVCVGPVQEFYTKCGFSDHPRDPLYMIKDLN